MKKHVSKEFLVIFKVEDFINKENVEVAKRKSAKDVIIK